MLMAAVLLAGGQMTLEDPLYSQAPDGYRSLIEICGKPMAQWVLDALTESEIIQTIYVMGLSAESGLTSSKPLVFLNDDGGLFENIRTGVLRAAQDHPDQNKVLIASADIPAVTSLMVAWLADQVEQKPDSFLYYNVISEEVMDQRFPAANRSYVRFKDVALCGGDINVVDSRLFTVERPLWKKLADARKSPLRQAGLLGFGNLLLVAFHAVTLEGAVKRVCKKLGVPASALLTPYAEMGMDADKPHQLAILRKNLEQTK